MQIADAVNSLRSSLGLRKCRQEQRRKNSYNRDDNQKFNQSEPVATAFW
jgi:hypothetical protein